MLKVELHYAFAIYSFIAGQKLGSFRTLTSALMTQAWPYRFCQELTPFVAYDGGPCTCYQRFG